MLPKEFLRAPFPYFGGKPRVAQEVWRRFGNVDLYIEPFAGSAAVLLGRPHSHRWWTRRELLNDIDGFLVNAWRAIKYAPDEVAKWAFWPVSEIDLTARHIWLLRHKEELYQKLLTDPEYFDAKAAGWWIWGRSVWIGGGWCSGRGGWWVQDGRLVRVKGGRGISKRLPQVSHWEGVNSVQVEMSGVLEEQGTDAGVGVRRSRPELGSFPGVLSQRGSGIQCKCPQLTHYQWVLSADDLGMDLKRPQLACYNRINGLGKAGISGDRAEEMAADYIRTWLRVLSNRLHRVMIISRDWKDAVKETIFKDADTIGVFLDPPYSPTERDDKIYNCEATSELNRQVRDWAVEKGRDPRYRIALCGYWGEYEMPSDWAVYRWTAQGGMGRLGSGRGKQNRFRETIWFSPHCLNEYQPSMLEDMP